MGCSCLHSGLSSYGKFDFSLPRNSFTEILSEEDIGQATGDVQSDISGAKGSVLDTTSSEEDNGNATGSDDGNVSSAKMSLLDSG